MNVFKEINKQLIKEGRFELIPEYYRNERILLLEDLRRNKAFKKFMDAFKTREPFLDVLRLNVYYRGELKKLIKEAPDEEKKAMKKQNQEYIKLTDEEVTEEKILEIIGDTNIDEILDSSVFNGFPIREYLNRLKDYKGLTYSEISMKSNFDEKYIKSIFRIHTRVRMMFSRNSMIALAFAYEMNPYEANYLLTIAGFNKFSFVKERDMVILKCLQDGMDIEGLNKILSEQGFKKIGNLEKSDER